MGTLDIILWVLIAIGVIEGLLKGALKQVAWIVGLIVGLLVARGLYSMVGATIAPMVGVPITIANILAFILIWIIVPFAFLGVAMLLTKALKAVHLGWLNRVLGAVVGALKFILMAGMIIHALEFVDPHEGIVTAELKSDSMLYQPIHESVSVIMPVIEKQWNQLKNK
ncbi:MAG: CvpA family protein [Bacteroidales bacterium]|nr:CvpA family protein [Bacteroidales bacterium]